MRTLSWLAVPVMLVACEASNADDAGRPDGGGAPDAPVLDAPALDAPALDAPMLDAATADAPVLDDAGPDAPLSVDARDGGAVALGCRTTAECPADARCTGIGSEGLGRCRDLTPIVGEGAECGADADCATNLVCTQTRPGGLCVPAWMLGTFMGTGTNIPDDDETGVTVSADALGVGTVSTEVVLRFRLEHGRSSDVRVYLTNPSGTEELAWNGNDLGEPVQPVRDIERIVPTSGDESANGLWRLRAVDLDPAETGRIVSWSITLRSRFD